MPALTQACAPPCPAPLPLPLRFLPEEVAAAEELSLAAEALVGEGAAAVCASDTLSVPGPLQDGEEKLVHDGLVAACTTDDHGGDVPHSAHHTPTPLPILLPLLPLLLQLILLPRCDGARVCSAD
ncbi:hypothetical protein Pmani_038758 [Petrolisthes manimaculis]|uniref:Uncharacterized protein n=1 Tax=Petrolisthes manimaculis TaxID=1843537 RepID=A0AAE1NEI6_9EUCA|nr:hypothetical protein Pmani_038758 [Petrolisthes manimaculis]